MKITTIGLDMQERVPGSRHRRGREMLAFFKALPPCLVGMEACATSTWGTTKLGHQDAGEGREGLRQA